MRDAHAVAREAAVASQLRRRADLACEVGAGAVREADREGGRLPQQRRRIERGAGRQRDHVADADALHGIVRDECLDEQFAGRRIGRAVADPQCVQARRGVESGKGGERFQRLGHQ